MKEINENIVACFLYAITKYGYPPNAKDTIEYLKEFKQLGFKSVELEGIRKEHLSEVYDIRHDIASTAVDLGLEIPIFCIVLPGLSSPEENVRSENLELFRKGCEIAEAIGAKAVLDNAPIPPWEFPSDIPVTRHYDEEVLIGAGIPATLHWGQYWKGLVETFRIVCDIAAEKNLSYHLHPCYGALINSADAYLRFSDAVKRDNLRLNLDTANQYFMKENLSLSLLKLKDHINYIHMSDNRGHKVEHLEIGKGDIQWMQFFETLDRIGYKGSFGIDVGGAESDVPDLDKAYRQSARYIEDKWMNK